MIEKITVYKQNHIKIIVGNKNVQIDPFMADKETKDADFVLITHDHYDHFSVQDIEKVSNQNTSLVVPENMYNKAQKVQGLVSKIITVKPNGSYNIDGLEFETIPAYNIGKPFHPKSAGWVGYVIQVEGKRIYIAGDTDATIEAKNVKCDIALVPIGGTYTLNAKEAASLVNAIKPEIAVPVHYGGIVGKEKDGQIFKENVDKSIDVVLKIQF